MDFEPLVLDEKPLSIDLMLGLEQHLRLLLKLFLLERQDLRLLPDFVLHVSKPLLVHLDLLALVFEVPLNLIELHLVRQGSIIQLGEDVNRLPIVDVERFDA
jgi:hypothetical protein